MLSVVVWSSIIHMILVFYSTYLYHSAVEAPILTGWNVITFVVQTVIKITGL